jgi:hypothetical protein
MVAHAYNPSTWEAEVGGSQIGGSLGYIVRCCLKKKKKKKVGRILSKISRLL